MSFLWFSQGAAPSAVIDLPELEASCLLVAAGTGLLGPRGRTHSDVGHMLAKLMQGGGTLFVALEEGAWPEAAHGKHALATAPPALRERLRAALEPALTRYAAAYREDAIVLVA